MDTLHQENIRQSVRENYGKIAVSEKSGCGCSPSSCCPSTSPSDASSVETPSEKASIALGYSNEDLSSIPQEADMGLGCGNPQAIASLQTGETVLDLGSGGGLDCFLAAKKVGPTGFVIGVDMTPEMVSKSRRNLLQGKEKNIDFRLGEIEHLPVADGTVDVIISNCVINLSPEKRKVFSEAFRVLKPKGRLAISDIVATKALPEAMKQNPALYNSCIAGAVTVDQIESDLKAVGFKEIKIHLKEESRQFIRQWEPGFDLGNFVVSATIEAKKMS